MDIKRLRKEFEEQQRDAWEESNPPCGDPSCSICGYVCHRCGELNGWTDYLESKLNEYLQTLDNADV